jgi:hypothetical protein
MLDQDRSHVNDIDLAVELVHKVNDRETAFELDQDYAASRQQEGRRFGTHIDFMFAARIDTLKFLRKRSRPLNFLRTEDEVGRSRLIASSMRMWPNGRKPSRSNHKLEGASALERTEGIMSEVRPLLALGVTDFILHITWEAWHTVRRA